MVGRGRGGNIRSSLRVDSDTVIGHISNISGVGVRLINMGGLNIRGCGVSRGSGVCRGSVDNRAMVGNRVANKSMVGNWVANKSMVGYWVSNNSMVSKTMMSNMATMGHNGTMSMAEHMGRHSRG